MAGDGTDIAICVDEMSKCYRIYEHPRDRLLEVISGPLHVLARPFHGASARKSYHREFWALRDVSFSIGRGETVGIMGRNGAGKSTLLQILAGTMNPTSGSVETHGRVAALLELGSGFNPEFTGRENVYFHASVMGLSRQQIDESFDEIASFADIGEFIQQPVKTYSTGMMMRLAFAVQTAIDPSILIVDEALSVGDARFQKKCFDRFRSFREAGKTILLVSHSADAITSMCDRAILLENGRVVADAEPFYVTKFYHRMLFGVPSDNAEAIDKSRNSKVESRATPPVASESPHAKDKFVQENQEVLVEPESKGEMRYGDRKVEIVELSVRDHHDAKIEELTSGGTYDLVLCGLVHEDIDDVQVGFLIRDQRGINLFGTDTLLQGVKIGTHKRDDLFMVRMNVTMWLAPGLYFLTAGISRSNGLQYDLRYDALMFKVAGNLHLYSDSKVNLNAGFSVTGLRRAS
jgi:lipopolysaccharide transport system ATP-binding protein